MVDLVMADADQLQPDAALAPEAVRKVARLARLEISAEESARYARELTSVLGYIERLREMDLAGVEPMAHTLDATSRLDPDEPGQTLPAETLLKLAPEMDGPFLKVPKVLGGGAGA